MAKRTPKTMLCRIARDIYSFYLQHSSEVDKRMILFSSHVDYSDNARALSDYLVNNDYLEKYDIYWAVKDVERCKKLYPDAKVKFISCIGWGSVTIQKYAYKSAWQFGTHGVVKFFKNHGENRHFINLWHGSSYKDNENKSVYELEFDNVKFDIALVAGPLFVKTKARFWNCSESRILPLGYPRYDWLLKKETNSRMFVDSLKKNIDTKVIIWMPTFRNDKNGEFIETDSITQFPLIDSNDKWHELDKWCSEYNVVLIVKLHPYQKEYDICWDELKNIINITNEDIDNARITLYSMLSCVDGLISDYSSVGVDFMVANKPIAFTLDDYEHYSSLRGFVVEDPRDYMPGHHLYTLQHLKTFVFDVASGSDLYSERRKELYGTLIHKSNGYCKELVEFLKL